MNSRRFSLVIWPLKLLLFQPWKFEWLEVKDAGSPMRITLCVVVNHILQILNTLQLCNLDLAKFFQAQQ